MTNTKSDKTVRLGIGNLSLRIYAKNDRGGTNLQKKLAHMLPVCEFVPNKSTPAEPGQSLTLRGAHNFRYLPLPLLISL